MPCVVVANLLVAITKTFAETPDTYLSCTEKYKACGQWFVALQAHVYTSNTNTTQ